MPSLFSPLTLRDLTVPNRVMVSPMCMYSSEDGFANDFHLVHLGAFALGSAGLIVTEATAVSPEGRISPQDLGLWKDEHVPLLRRITDFVHAQGSTIAVQLAHAGRKASAYAPGQGRGAVPPEQGGWKTVAPSAQRFHESYDLPIALDADGIRKVVNDFAAATRRALEANFDAVEIHAAHGYLLHQFMSPLSNTREDAYGGSFENRVRLLLEVTRAVRAAWPQERPLLVRLSGTEWVESGWSLEDSVELARQLKAEGVDLIDVSSGGNDLRQQLPPLEPGYQVPLAATIRREADVPTAAVGLITEPHHAQRIVESGEADLVALAREMLRDPHWTLRAARELGCEVRWPRPYERAR
ncbi:2,4-dienoyl-CoA reductase-like NADH-dependent reductase (Old Yellow Enzyme family) [Deinobacterium chartae]|uniref:2,4-dienoyl-CoA reductase-like NADH-dependent reductase (Old Yellow Enzyme family) n=1 Tax=Deinobacterium chartae TaxID=521158 RepID=A0A841I1Y9_9DEIO|nr:NADH:flavin oxidoreductase/NADH oxidase [Deinobacterium chartae]MBB6097955.1 2,4-dienoyl-CoA reductase-like NADH-dependent reductase (Old Yellow Enzyme family) [Deinobacterium chartae]